MKELFDSLLGFEQLEWLLRLLCAGICGGAVGLERSRRLKDAGIRTHVIVAIGAALVVLVSKYGFLDLPLDNPNVRIDVSRVASNIISGISFLGAGVIFVRGSNIKGLTTAAGIWTTAGIGLSFGSGLYFIGFSATIIMTILQYALHKIFKNIDGGTVTDISVAVANSPEAVKKFKEHLEERNAVIQNCKVSKDAEANTLNIKASIRIPGDVSFENVVEIMQSNPDIKSFEI